MQSEQKPQNITIQMFRQEDKEGKIIQKKNTNKQRPKQQNIKAFLCSTLMKSYAFCYVFLFIIIVAIPSSYVEVRALEIMAFNAYIGLIFFFMKSEFSTVNCTEINK